ncbi:hypothetical protein [Hyphomonas sp.]|uniref:hypothetical protein n=1 Tax=Hyphomonas sp. TaxID=87 RepID=UPI003919CD44
MPVITRLAALAAAAFALAAPVAAAEDCEAVILPRAVGVIQAVTGPGVNLSEKMAEMDGYVTACPDHGWVNVMAAELDLMIFKTTRSNNGGSATQEGVNFLARAFLRSGVFQQGPDENRKERYLLPASSGTVNLTYSVASNNRKAIIEALGDLAKSGTVHPYLKPASPVACSGWAPSDAQTLAYKVSAKADMALLPFVEAVADGCRAETNQGNRMPLAVLAEAYMDLVKTGQVTEPAEVKRLLIAARRAADDFIATSSYHSFFFSESDDRELIALLRKHGVHAGDGPEIIDRALWFTPDYIGSEVAIRSIAYSLDELWTPLAAGETPGTAEEVAKARNLLTSYLLQLNKQGSDAGLKTETGVMLREALSAFHTGEIRKPGTPVRKPMPTWLYDTQMKLLTPQP